MHALIEAAQLLAPVLVALSHLRLEQLHRRGRDGKPGAPR